jgi:phosphoenolpyruvate carboxykinase (ATP)
VPFETESAFGFSIPRYVPDVPRELLNPRNAWSDKAEYDRKAAELAARFTQNFERFEVSDVIRNAGPRPRS